jgi:hypothetical protein
VGVLNCGGFSVLRRWPVSVGVFIVEGREYGLMFGWAFELIMGL